MLHPPMITCGVQRMAWLTKDLASKLQLFQTLATSHSAVRQPQKDRKASVTGRGRGCDSWFWGCCHSCLKCKSCSCWLLLLWTTINKYKVQLYGVTHLDSQSIIMKMMITTTQELCANCTKYKDVPAATSTQKWGRGVVFGPSYQPSVCPAPRLV